ncbi:hypothetical protein D3C85_1314990 [compost metagenome]
MCTSITWCHSAPVILCSMAGRVIPALFTRMSMGPSSPLTVAAAALTAAWSAMSQRTNRALPPSALISAAVSSPPLTFTSMMATLAPSAA